MQEMHLLDNRSVTNVAMYLYLLTELGDLALLTLEDWAVLVLLN